MGVPVLEAVRPGHLPRRQRRPAHVQRLPVRRRQPRVQHEPPDGRRVRQRRHADTALVRLRVHGLDTVGPERRETGTDVPAPKSGRSGRRVRRSVLGGGRCALTAAVSGAPSGRRPRDGSDGEKRNNKILTSEDIFVLRDIDDGPAKAMVNHPPTVFVKSIRKSANNKHHRKHYDDNVCRKTASALPAEQRLATTARYRSVDKTYFFTLSLHIRK